MEKRGRQGKGDLFGGGVVAIVTEVITGIIVNDYRNNHRRRCRRRRARPQSKRSGRPLSLADEEEHGPNPKGVADPDKSHFPNREDEQEEEERERRQERERECESPRERERLGRR